MSENITNNNLNLEFIKQFLDYYDFDIQKNQIIDKFFNKENLFWIKQNIIEFKTNYQLSNFEEIWDNEIHNLIPKKISDLFKNNHNFKKGLWLKLINQILNPLFINFDPKGKIVNIDKVELDCRNDNIDLFLFIFLIIKEITSKNDDEIIKILLLKNVVKSIKNITVYYFSNYYELLEKYNQINFVNIQKYFYDLPKFIAIFLNFIKSYISYNERSNININNELYKFIDSINNCDNDFINKINIKQIEQNAKKYLNSWIDNFESLSHDSLIKLLNYILEDDKKYIIDNFIRSSNEFKKLFNHDILIKIIYITIGYFISINKIKECKKFFLNFINKYSIDNRLTSVEDINKIESVNDNILQKQFCNWFKISFNQLIIPNYLNQVSIEDLNYDKNINILNEEYNKLYAKLKKLLEDFLNEYYHNSYDKKNLELFLKEHNNFFKYYICLLFANINQIEKINIDHWIYEMIYKYEMGRTFYTKKKCFPDFNKTTKDEYYQNRKIICDSYNEDKLKKDIKIVFANYMEYIDIDKINITCFVDNNLLSNISRFDFSIMEQCGDNLYKAVIINLILEAKIKHIILNLECFSANFQNELTKNIEWDKIIQTNNLYFGEDFKYSNADYFEALIFQIYRTNGYYVLKNFIFKLITENKNNLILNEDKDLSWFKKESEEVINNFTQSLNYKFIPYTCIIDGNNENSVDKLILSFNNEFINICNILDINKANSNMNFVKHSIEWSIPKISNKEFENMNRNLYHLSQSNFEDFYKNITVIFNGIKRINVPNRNK